RESLVAQFTIPNFLLRPPRTIQATLHAHGTDRRWLDPDPILKIMHQRIDIDVLDALARLMRPVASPPLGLAHFDPISRFVTRTVVGLGLDKTLQQPRTQTVTALEIRADAPGAKRQYMRGQIG